MQKFKVSDNGNQDGTAKNALVGVTPGTNYKAEVWNDNLFNLFTYVENAGYSLIDNDLSQLTKAAKGAYRSTFTYNTSAIATQTVSDIVLGSDGVYYEAQDDGIIGDDPVGSVTGKWKESSFQAFVRVDNIASLKAMTKIARTIHVEGYYTSDDRAFKSNLFRYNGVVPDTSSDNGGTVQVVTISATHYQYVLESKNIDMEMFGAKGDGVTDGTTSILKCLTYAIDNNIEVRDYSGNTYLYTSDISLIGSLTFNGNVTMKGTGAGLYLSGALTEIGSISAAAAKLDNAATLSTVAGLNDKDLVILENDIDFSYSLHRSNYHDGEFIRIKSIAGNVATFETNLLTSYAGVATDKVFKLTPIKVDINGVSFDSTDTGYALYVKYCENSNINIKEISNDDVVGSSAAFGIDKSYNCKINGGRFDKAYGTSGNDYGIVVINSQSIKINGADSFGGRHAVATGGDAADGAVPNRFIYVEGGTLANDATASIYCADFHGNTIDSHYKNCTVYGSIGLGGENVFSIDCDVYQSPASNDSPLLYHELVGGDLGFIRCKAIAHSTGTAFAILDNASSSLVDNISKPYRIIVEDLEAEMTANTSRIVNAYESSGQVNSWKIDGFNITGDLSSYTTIMAFTLAAGGIDPTSIEIENPKYIIPNSKTLVSKSGTTLAGVIATMPEFTTNEDLTILAGNFQSTVGGTAGTLVHDYPTFPAIPQRILSASGSAVSGDGYVFVVGSNDSTASNGNARLTMGAAAHLVGADKTQTVTSMVTMKKYVL